MEECIQELPRKEYRTVINSKKLFAKILSGNFADSGKTVRFSVKYPYIESEDFSEINAFFKKASEGIISGLKKEFRKNPNIVFSDCNFVFGENKFDFVFRNYLENGKKSEKHISIGALDLGIMFRKPKRCFLDKLRKSPYT